MSAPPRVKICGCTSTRDLNIAVESGADAVGFLVGLSYDSEDEVTPAQVAQLVPALPPFVTPVLVTHETGPTVIADLCRETKVQHLQLHGDFALDDIHLLREQLPSLKIIKAIHVEDRSSIDAAVTASAYVDAVILDTRTTQRLGGTGLVHDWSISRAIRDSVYPAPVVLAGGLNPGNVQAAIGRVLPYGVDVNSGVSRRRGVKSAELVARFVPLAKSAY